MEDLLWKQVKFFLVYLSSVLKRMLIPFLVANDFGQIFVLYHDSMGKD